MVPKLHDLTSTRKTIGTSWVAHTTLTACANPSTNIAVRTFKKHEFGIEKEHKTVLVLVQALFTVLLISHHMHVIPENL